MKSWNETPGTINIIVDIPYHFFFPPSLPIFEHFRVFLPLFQKSFARIQKSSDLIYPLIQQVVSVERKFQFFVKMYHTKYRNFKQGRQNSRTSLFNVDLIKGTRAEGFERSAKERTSSNEGRAVLNPWNIRRVEARDKVEPVVSNWI